MHWVDWLIRIALGVSVTVVLLALVGIVLSVKLDRRREPGRHRRGQPDLRPVRDYLPEDERLAEGFWGSEANRVRWREANPVQPAVEIPPEAEPDAPESPPHEPESDPHLDLPEKPG